jgi:hypothetical protein
VSALFRGRYTAQVDGPFVVFIVGMRVNRLRAVHRWLPVVSAMRPMLRQLMTQRDLGLLHVEPLFYWRGVALLQYWRSFGQLEQFARSPAATHLEAWKRFNRSIGGEGSVGIWHETYLVQAGQYEAIYGNMPRRGLARAGEHLPAIGRLETAKRRLGLDGEPAVPSYDNPGAPRADGPRPRQA